MSQPPRHFFSLHEALIMAALAALGGVSGSAVSWVGASLHAVVPASSPLTASEVASRLAAAGFTGAEVDVVEPTIEDVFVNLVSRQR